MVGLPDRRDQGGFKRIINFLSCTGVAEPRLYFFMDVPAPVSTGALSYIFPAGIIGYRIESNTPGVSTLGF